MSLIKVDQLTKRYGHGDASIHALEGMQFEIQEGEFVAVMGESGSGKSTLLSVMGAMNAPSSGRYLVDDIDIYELTSEKRCEFRREYLGFIFQAFHLVPYLTVLENVMLPLTTVRQRNSEKRRMAMEALEWVGLADKPQRLPSDISGGENERVAIARAIVNEPPILLADEPTGNLDTRTSNDMMALLTRLNQNGMTIVMVTHSAGCARYARRLLSVQDGRLMADNPVKPSERDTVQAAPLVAAA